jgi:diacylglycerol kinase family enzyme
LGLAGGYFSLVILRGSVSRLQLVRAFLAAEQGLGGAFPYIEQYKVSSVVIDADTTEGLSHSGLELFGTRSIRVDVKPSAAQFWKGS